MNDDVKATPVPGPLALMLVDWSGDAPAVLRLTFNRPLSHIERAELHRSILRRLQPRDLFVSPCPTCKTPGRCVTTEHCPR